MTKVHTTKNKYHKLMGLFILIFSINIVVIHFLKFLPININYTGSFGVFKLNIYSIIAIVGFALLEEFISRFFITVNGWVGALWLFWHSYFTVIPYLLGFYKINHTLLDAIYILFSLVSVMILSKYKNNILYEQIFTPSKTKIIASVVGFSFLHLSNYNIEPSQIIYMMIYLLILRGPFALFLSNIHLNFKNGFLIATGLHALNNILALCLSLIFPWL